MALKRVGLDYVDKEVDYGVKKFVDHMYLYERNVTFQPSGEAINWYWTTYDGIDVNPRFRLDIRYRGWMRGVNNCTNWSSARQIMLESTACSHSMKDGMNLWEHDMNIGGMFQEISGGMWRFDVRTYDRIDFEITVTAYHPDDYAERTGRATDAVASAQVTIEYIPRYQLLSMYQERSDLVVLEYSTTWERKNDRFNINSLYVVNGSNYEKALIANSYWNYVSEVGRIEIPTSKLCRHIANQMVYVAVDFNADYRVSGQHLSETIGYFNVEDLSHCNSAYITLDVKDGQVYAKTGENQDGYSTPTTVTVKMVDGEYGFDQHTVLLGETAVFEYPPFNKVLKFEAVASNGFATSRVTTAQCPPIMCNVYRLDSMREGDFENLEWRASSDDAGISVTARSNYELVDLARSYPTAFYGEGGEKEISYNCVLIDDTGLHLEAMAIYGDLLLRAPDTRRYPFAGEIRITRPSVRITKIAISGTVVSG